MRCRGSLVKRLRFRLRTLCLVVMGCAMILGGWSELGRRRERFGRLWQHHYLTWADSRTETPGIFDPDCEPNRHYKLAEAYAEAWASPWLPGPDPKAFGF